MDCLMPKWKLWYKSLDVNHDGTISLADMEESRTKFAEMSELTAQKTKEVNVDFENWWNTYIFRGRTGDISEDMFCGDLAKSYQADKSKFIAEITDCFNKFFDVIDVNKDRTIDEGEFLAAFQAYGHENVASDKKFFASYNPDNGQVPFKKIVDSWIQFVSSDDSSKPDVVKAALEAGV